MEISEAAFDYSIRIAEIVKHLRSEDRHFPLCEYLLKSSVEAGLSLRDPPDMVKAVDSLKTVDYLLEMSVASGYLTERQAKLTRDNGYKLILKLRSEERRD